MYAYYIKKAANGFVKEYGVTSKTVDSFKLLLSISEKEAYKVYRFSDEHDEIIQLLNVESFCRTNIAFSVRQGDMRCIFIKSDVPDKVAAKLLLHELAHIRLRHLDKCKTTAFISENDADVFVNYVRTKVCRNARQTHRLLAAVMVCLAVTAMLYTIHSRNTSNSEYSIAVPVVNEVSVTDTSTVYITDTGSKYHERDCYHLKGRHVVQPNFEIWLDFDCTYFLVSKSSSPYGLVGSNPTASANEITPQTQSTKEFVGLFFYCHKAAFKMFSTSLRSRTL